MTDGDGEKSNQSTVSINVATINDPPTANDDDATVAENAVVTINLRGNDSDADNAIESLTLNLGEATNGTLTDKGDGTVDYQHDGSETLGDSFTYTLHDGVSESDPATVTITVTAVNDPPQATNDDVTVDENAVVTIDLRSNDSDADDTLESLTLSLGGASNGTLFNNDDGTVDYQHDGSETSSDSFTYTLHDGDAGSDPATVDITVTPVNDEPVAVDDSVLVIENTPTTFNVIDNDIDVDGDLLTVADNTDASDGSVVDNGDGTFQYTPNTDYVGPDSFEYTVDDGNGGTDTGTVNITVSVSGTAVVSELLDPEMGGGVGELEGSDDESVHLQFSYYKEQFIPATETFFEIEFEYNYNSGSFVIETDDFFDDEIDSFLKADGSWVNDDQVEVVVSTVNHGDGSMSLSIVDSNDAEELGRFRVRAQTIDLGGQPMVGNIDEQWAAQLLDPAALFGPGALGLSSYTFEPEIDLFEWEVDFGCSEEDLTQYNGNCDTVIISNIFPATVAATLDDLIVDTAWVDPDDYTEAGLVRVGIANNFNGVLYAELVSTDNTVNYYFLDYSSSNSEDYITLLVSDVGGWERDSTFKNTEMIRYVIPPSVVVQFPEIGDFVGDRRRVFLERDGFVRGNGFAELAGEIEPSDGGELNGIAIDQVLANFDPPPKPDFDNLVGTWRAELHSSNGDQPVFHIFDNGRFEKSGTCDFDGTTGMAYGTFYFTGSGLPIEWNEVTGEFGAFDFDSSFSECDLRNYRDDTLLVNGDVLTHHIPGHGNIVYNRMQAASNPLVGSWISGDINDSGEGHVLLTFFGDTTFTLSQNCESDGLLGFEYGSYNWDQGNTDALSGMLTIDTNGSCGAHDDNGMVFSGLTMTVDGNTLVINDGFDDSVFNRHSTPNLPCSYESGWIDEIDEPANFNSFDQFEGVLESCGGRLPLAEVDLINSSWVETSDDEGVAVVETITFNQDGTAEVTETRDGSPTFDVNVNWSVSNNYVMVSSVLYGFQDVWAMTAAGLKAYTEEAGWSSNPDLATLDDALEGEIWTPQHVNSANIAPIGNPDFAMINEDTPVTTGNVLDNDLDSGPAGLSIDDFDTVSANGGSVAHNGDGSFDYSPVTNFNGDDTFTYTVSDGEDTGIATVTITVHSVNDLPVIQQSGPLAVVVDEDHAPEAFVLPAITAIDVDNGSLFWSSPGALKGDANVSGVGPSPAITYLANMDANGADSFEVKVHDGNGGRDSILVNVTITPVNDLPVLAGTPQSFATDGVPYHFTPIGVDPDDQTKEYSIVNQPLWADFDADTGTLSGTPGLSDVGGNFVDIVISLSTGADTVSLPGFSITVNSTTGLGAKWNEFNWDDGSSWQNPPPE